MVNLDGNWTQRDVDEASPRGVHLVGGADDGGARPDLDLNKPVSPADLSKLSLIALVERAGKEDSRDNLTDLAAGLTYYGVPGGSPRGRLATRRPASSKTSLIVSKPPKPPDITMLTYEDASAVEHHRGAPAPMKENQL